MVFGWIVGLKGNSVYYGIITFVLFGGASRLARGCGGALPVLEK